MVGALFVALFGALGGWQISRGLDKRATEQLFRDAPGYTSWHDGMEVRPYQQLEATGEFDGDHQLLLENIIVDGRNGYYVITPLVGLADEPVLLVNRGWIERSSDLSQLGISRRRISVRGRAGWLPRAGYRMGDAINAGSTWPKVAVYPTADEVAAALGRDVQPFVLLMDEDEPDGFVRSWAPATRLGPGKHFGYAVQWFAMAAVLSGLLIWNYRKKRFQ